MQVWVADYKPTREKVESDGAGSVVSSPIGSWAEPQTKANFLSFCSLWSATGEILKQLVEIRRER